MAPKIDLDALAEQRRASVASLPLEEIYGLPECSTDQVMFGRTKVSVAVWHETLDNGAHRVIVQVGRERLWGIVAGVAAMGYEFSTAAAPRKLREDELYDYT